jgi:hypothetical protein
MIQRFAFIKFGVGCGNDMRREGNRREWMFTSPVVAS